MSRQWQRSAVEPSRWLRSGNYRQALICSGLAINLHTTESVDILAQHWHMKGRGPRNRARTETLPALHRQTCIESIGDFCSMSCSRWDLGTDLARAV
jgi:hypothetical protein